MTGLCDDYRVSRMLVATRFGIGIQDPAWYEHRLMLLSAITLPSLLAQTDQEFEWALVVDRSLSSGVRRSLEHLLSPLGDRVHLCAHGSHLPTLRHLARDRCLVDQAGYLLAGRLDDDDAWARDTVSAVRKRVEQWHVSGDSAPGYGLSFEDGIAWMMYDMINLDKITEEGQSAVVPAALKPYAFPFTSISGYTYAEADEALTALVTGHARVEEVMKEKGYAIDIVSTQQPMWLYCRHKQTDAPVNRGKGPVLKMTVADLAERFGIDEEAAQSYIANSDRYGYVRSLRMQGLRANATRELRKVERTLAVTSSDSQLFLSLMDRRIALEAELSELSGNAVEAPGGLPSMQ